MRADHLLADMIPPLIVAAPRFVPDPAPILESVAEWVGEPETEGEALDHITDLAYLREQVRLAREELRVERAYGMDAHQRIMSARRAEIHARQEVLHLQRELERAKRLHDDLVRSLFTAGASPEPPTDPDPDPAPPAPTFPH